MFSALITVKSVLELPIMIAMCMRSIVSFLLFYVAFAITLPGCRK